MVNFAELKKRRSEDLEKLKESVKKITTNENSSSDDRFWYPATDKAGNGYAVIRFLPAPDKEDVPFIRLWNHSFKGPSGAWYIENCLTTIGQDDPVSEYNTKLWNSTTDDKSPERAQARLQKRKLTYISNIYVVQDPANPENEGKVFLFKYGKKLFDKLQEAMTPQFEDEQPFNPFDLWDGANFKIKIRQVEGYRNYDKSVFDEPAPLSKDDKVLEKIWASEYSLQAFLDPSNFKSYDVLKKKLETVLGTTEVKKKATVVDEEEELPQASAPKLRTRESKPKIDDEDDTPPFATDDEDEESLSYFNRLVESD